MAAACPGMLQWCNAVSRSVPPSAGQADFKVQAYNFRMCFSSDPSNQLPIPKPSGYDASQWELLRRFVNATAPTSLSQLMIISHMPGNKTDVNNNGAIR